MDYEKNPCLEYVDTKLNMYLYFMSHRMLKNNIRHKYHFKTYSSLFNSFKARHRLSTLDIDLVHIQCLQYTLSLIQLNIILRSLIPLCNILHRYILGFDLNDFHFYQQNIIRYFLDIKNIFQFLYLISLFQILHISLQ